MATTYKWLINQMDAHVESEGEDNVIFKVHWTYSGSDEVGYKTYSSTRIGVESFSYKASSTFIPYENTEAFEKVVIGWLEASLDMVSMKANIEADIQKEITPINENLYFTWQEPVEIIK
tara:strand:- start:218 stop:574 length:357 start_codon:yes stop_codon:yes gene_type:complete